MGWLKLQRSGPRLLRELAIRAHSQPITHAVLDDHPPSNTLHRIRHLLVLAGVLPQRTELLDRIEPWLDQLLADRPHHHTAVVRPFVTWHALRRARQRAPPPGHRRIGNLCPHPGHRDPGLPVLARQLQQNHDHSQPGRPGPVARQRQADQLLPRYLHQLGQRPGPLRPDRPNRPNTQPEAFLDEDDLWNMLGRCLHEQHMPIDVRSRHPRTVLRTQDNLFFGRKTTSFMSLTIDDIQQVDGETYLRLDDFNALLPPAAAAVFHTLQMTSASQGSLHRPDSQTRDLSPGRSPGQPMTPNSMSSKLRAHGITSLPARNAARASWARDLPSPIAADLLGIHINTATQWASRSRRDWSDYITARAQAQEGDDAQAQH